MSPHQPQMFYPVTNKDMIVENGDIIEARCTINSMERNSVTRTGLVNNYKHISFIGIFLL